MAKVFSIFADDRNDHSKMVKQLLSNQVPPVPVPKTKPQPHRPNSASPNIVVSKPVISKAKQNKGAQPVKDEINQTSREDLVIELQDVKRRFRSLEETYSQVKAENQRLEFEATKQQRRIDQLLNLADGAKNIGISSDIRRDIEKSILVRQLKNQINNLRDDYAEKEAELDALRRNTKSTHLSEIENERDEYYLEVQRLKAALLEVKEELHRERQRREWNTRVAGDTSDDLRKEVARLSSGYQNILANISSRASGNANSTARPATSTGTRGSAATPEAAAAHANRPVSATAGGPSHPAPSATKDPERPKRPLSATSRNTPLSTYYQGDTIPSVGTGAASNPQGMAMFSDPLDNFGLLGATTPPTTGTLHPELRAHLQDASFPEAARADSGVFKIGDRVQGQFQGGSAWYHGAIEHYNAVAGTYAVRYDDGDHEADVPLARLRASSATVEVVPVKANVPVPTLAPAPASHPALMGGTNNMFKPKPQPAPVAAASILAAPYKVGDKIEALYYKGTTWYGGKVQAVHAVPNAGDGEFAFDITYDDGDRELKVPQANVRFPAGSAPAAAATNTSKASTTNAPSPTVAPSNKAASVEPHSPPAAALFKVGDSVEGFYGGGPSWYGAKVSKINPVLADGKLTYILDYNDGDREVAVLERNVRHAPQSPRSPKPAAATATATVPASSTAAEKPASPAYKKGDRVQGFFPEYDAWYDGTVEAGNSDGTYHVRYDDGDEDRSAAASKLRAAPQSAQPASPVKASAPVPTSAVTSAKYKVDEKVEGKYGGGDAWYPAVVSSVQKAGSAFSYSLRYDDGDREDDVSEGWVRALPPSSPHKAATTHDATASSDTHTSPPARKASLVTTNLDSFLNDLSDDEDSTGGLDAGKGMMLPQGAAAEVPPRSAPADADEGDGYDEDFDA